MIDYPVSDTMRSVSYDDVVDSAISTEIITAFSLNMIHKHASMPEKVSTRILIGRLLDTGVLFSL